MTRRTPTLLMLILLAAGLVLSAGAASGRAAEWSVGLGLDVARTGLSGRAPQDGKYQARFGPGVAAAIDREIATGVQLSFQPGWIQGGTNLEFEESPDLDREISIDYLELPLLVRVYTEAARRVRPYALAGLAVGIPLRAEVGSAGGTEDVLDQLEPADARAKFGLGLRFPAGSGHAFVDLVYTQGLTNLTRNGTDPETPADPERYKGTAMTLRLTWMVAL